MSGHEIIDDYHPLVQSDHEATCASLCTNWNESEQNTTGCGMTHMCWCPDGALLFDEFQAKHPDVSVAEA